MLNKITGKIILFWPVIKYLFHFIFFIMMITNLYEHNRDHNIINQLKILIEYAQMEPQYDVSAIDQS